MDFILQIYPNLIYKNLYTKQQNLLLSCELLMKIQKLLMRVKICTKKWVKN